MMDVMISLSKDAGKMKDWLSSKCSTVTVEGDNVAPYWDLMGMESNDMPTSMSVCQASDGKIRTLVTYGLGALCTFCTLVNVVCTWMRVCMNMLMFWLSLPMTLRFRRTSSQPLSNF